MFGLVESELPMARDLSFALSARFRVRALDGDVGQAFSDVLMCCRYGLHFRGPKPTTEQLFGLAISAISVEKAFLILHEVEPDEDLWETLQMEMEAIDLQAVLNNMTRDNGFVHTLLLDAGKVTAMTYQFQSHLQALITTLAVQRYHMHSGSPPGNLQDLVAAGFLDALHDDPFGDQPLHYRLTDGHFILYSNGFDCDDDGGVHDKKWGRDGDGDFVFWPVMVEGRTQ